jgi:UDP-2-acetamido-2,6-beta-L-arabino-hexul-4-ose reductase
VRVLVTGARGFIGKNLAVALSRRADVEALSFDRDSEATELERLASSADVIFHLAGVNRPERVEEFREGNAELTRRLCGILRAAGRAPLLVLSSSTQASLDNPYGQSKRAAEDVVRAFGEASGARVRVFRLPGVFGKWGQPNYNSVVATYCHNVARGLAISVSDPDRVIELVHVDDVVRVFVGLLDGQEVPSSDGFCGVEPVHRIALADLAGRIQAFRNSRSTLEIPDFSDSLTRLLHSTYLAYLPEGGFAYQLQQRVDARGELAELLRSRHFGQIFVSRTRPGITRGNHYHDAKVEKFVVVEGEAVVRFRSLLGGGVSEYPVSGRDFTVVDIPPGYTHHIENVGKSDLVVLFWASEPFDPQRPDTWAEEV